MTARMADERDPLPEAPHVPVSSEWARKAALEATEQAIKAAKEKRGVKYGGAA